MHTKYARDGVVCVSLSVDELPEREATLKFLKSKKATFANYLLNEEVGVWQEKLKITGPPAVFVFDRDGKVAARFDTNDSAKEFTYADVEQVVKKLLKADK